MSWAHFRAVNPLLQEMFEYNSRVRDRVVAAKKTRTTPPADEAKCKGQCEGRGVVPVFGDEWVSKNENDVRPARSSTPEDQEYQKLWMEAEKVKATEDGWHFVRCRDCEGTGKAKEESTNTCLEDLRALF